MPESELPQSEEFEKIFEWFNDTVTRLEGAYNHLETKFTEVSQELDAKSKSLVQMEENLEALLTSMKPGVIIVDSQMVITGLNLSSEKMLQVDSKEAMGRPLFEIFPEGCGLGKSFKRAFEKPLEIVEEDRYVRLEGIEFPASFKCSAIIDGEGQVNGAMETFSDLSSFRQLEEEVQQARVLGAMGEMAATVAHEIRNPLGGIGGYAGLLARDIETEDPRKRLVDKIIQGVGSLNNIVSNMLNYTRKTKLRPVTLHFAQYLEELLMFFEVELSQEDKEIEVIRDFTETHFEVEIDPEKLQQVLLNFLQNSAQAIEKTGFVRMALRQENGDAVLEIQDNGVGMDEETQNQLFKPFFTKKEQGSGLGMAIAKKIIDLHHGEIKLRSELQVGTLFEIRLKGVVHG